ncbi:MAG TPA: DUF2269 family protein [Gaiellaceae bacterium]|nr:DUF2269 family protein [Gaiellaceae bacterium]
MSRAVDESTPKGFASPIPLDALAAGLLLLAGAIVFLWYSPASYQVYLALHILAVTVWVGGDVTLTTLGVVFERKQDGPTLAALGRMGAWIGTRVYTPTLFLVFGFGVALIEKANLPWDRFWIVFGIVGWSLATLIGVGFVGPELGRIDRTAREFGPESPEVAKRVRRLFMIFRFDTALLVLVVLDMAAKPSF